jgi:hypothetical protein
MRIKNIIPVLTCLTIACSVKTKQKVFYSTGEIKAEYSITKDSIRNGPFVNYFKNGKIKVKGSYSNNLLNGTFEVFDENGHLNQEGNYLDGQNHGKEINYYKGGRIENVANWNNGKLDGVLTFYSESGVETCAKYFTNGELDSGKVNDSLGRFEKNIRPVEFVSKLDTLKVGEAFYANISLRGFSKFTNGLISIDFIPMAEYDAWKNHQISVRAITGKFTNPYTLEFKFIKGLDKPGPYIIEGDIFFNEINGKENNSKFEHRIFINP